MMPPKGARAGGRGRGRGRGRGGRRADPDVIALDDISDDAQKDDSPEPQSDANEEQSNSRNLSVPDNVDEKTPQSDTEGSPEPISSGDEEEKEKRAEKEKKRAERATKNTATLANVKAESVQDSDVKLFPPRSTEETLDSAPRKRRRVASGAYAEPDDDAVQSSVSSTKQTQSRRSNPRSVKAELVKQDDVVEAQEIQQPAPAPVRRRQGRRGKWDEEKLVTNPNSPLVDVDLVQLFLLPSAWNCLSESEKREILALLPENIHPEYMAHAHEPDYIIPPLPEEFLRYSNAWRDSVRQFGIDLALGRYTEKWQRDAAEASRQRALGMFDDFKEQEFEAFWGQKQKLDRSLVAGESSKIKLETLVRAGVIKVGDVWKYSRIIKKEKHGVEGGEEVFIEKECKVIGINDGALTFVIPPGKKVFLSDAVKDLIKNMSAEGKELTPTEAQVPSETQVNAEPSASQQSTRSQSGSPEPLSDNASDDDYKPTRRLRSRAVKNTNGNASGASVSRPGNREVTTRTMETGEIVYENILTPNQLGSRILEVDGRIKDPPNGNAWKDYRCFRNNQDMGSLWEVRHLWYTRTH